MNNPDLDKKEMSRPMSAFMRLQFKSNNKTNKSTGKVDLKKQKRVRQEQFHSQTTETDSEAASDTEQLSCQKIVKKVQNKMAQSRPKETRKEVAKMKIKIHNNNECVIESKGTFLTLSSCRIEVNGIYLNSFISQILMEK